MSEPTWASLYGSAPGIDLLGDGPSDTQDRLDTLATLDQSAQNVLLGSLVTVVSGEQWTLALRLVDQIRADMAAAREDAK